MSGVNKVILLGRLGRDPELRYTAEGTPVANFSIATSDEWKDKKTGEKKEKTEWHRIVVWRKLAEICGEYLSKGRQVYIEGKLSTRSWEQNGEVKYTTEVIATDIHFVGTRSVIVDEVRSEYENKEFVQNDYSNDISSKNLEEEEVPF